MTASKLAISSAKMIMSRPVRCSTGTWRHRSDPLRYRSRPGIFREDSLEGPGPCRQSYRGCRRLESYGATPAAWRILAPPAHVSIKGFRAMLSAKRDNVNRRGFALWWFGRGFFVGRVCPARVVAHAGTITLQVLILFLAPISRAAIPAALYVWRLEPVLLV